MNKEYEELIENFIQDMERVKAPVNEFYEALGEAEGAIRGRINIGRDLGETE